MEIIFFYTTDQFNTGTHNGLRIEGTISHIHSSLSNSLNLRVIKSITWNPFTAVSGQLLSYCSIRATYLASKYEATNLRPGITSCMW